MSLGIAAARSGFKTEFYSKPLDLDKSNLDLDYYKKYLTQIYSSRINC